MENFSDRYPSITRNNPATFIFLLDQSGSMMEQISFNGIVKSKADSLAITVNAMIAEILNRSRREDGYRDYFHIAALGYSNDEVYSLLDPPSKAIFFTPNQLNGMKTRNIRYDAKRHLPNGMTTTTTLETRQWIAPHADGKTPMFKALVEAYRLAQERIQIAGRNGHCAIIFNITDGEASDASDSQLIDVAEKIGSIKSNNGNVLLINMHISSNSADKSIVFPASKSELSANKYAELLFDMSGIMPKHLHNDLVELTGKSNQMEFRAMSFNASMIDLFQIMNIGTMSVNLA